MKNLSITVAVTALVAFSLGYFARGAVERAQNESGNLENLTVREHAEVAVSQTQAELKVRGDSDDKDDSITASVDRNAVLTNTSTTPRQILVANKRKRLGDFFLLNGVGADRAEQILQDLVDADHNRVQKQNAIIDQRQAEKAQDIVEGRAVGIGLTKEERTDLRAEKETVYRQIFGEYYYAHQEYERSYQQREIIGTFSSNLSTPLEYAAKESMVQIMYEENSATRSDLAIAYAQAGGNEHKMYDANLRARKSFNDRVLGRARSYLTSSQFEQFKKLLDDDFRRTELQFELSRMDGPG